MPISFKERLDLLQRASAGWLGLKKAIESLDPQQLDTPIAMGGWTGRELIVHIAVWDDELTRVLLDLDSGEHEVWPPADGDALDAWNEERVAAFRELPTGDSFDYFEQAHFELMELLEQSPSATRALIEPAIAHYGEHLEHIKQLKHPRRP